VYACVYVCTGVIVMHGGYGAVMPNAYVVIFRHFYSIQPAWWFKDKTQSSNSMCVCVYVCKCVSV